MDKKIPAKKPLVYEVKRKLPDYSRQHLGMFSPKKDVQTQDPENTPKDKTNIPKRELW